MPLDSKRGLQYLLARYGQEQILAFYDKLSPEQRESLAAQAGSIDLDLIAKLSGEDAEEASLGTIEPEPFVRLPHDEASRRQWDDARAVGMEALRAGRVAAMVVAGGQGTRLGFSGPKGAFPIGPVTNRTLFQIHAEKVRAASCRYGREIPLLVMTSPSNDAETKFFFKENLFFGLPFTSVKIFSQGEMPAVDSDGKIILDRPDHAFMSPNGHGGALKALWDSGVIAWLEEKGIDTISCFQVDNPLARAVDPTFIGFHISAGSEMSFKLLHRTIPEEKLGIWLSRNGRARIIEYSDMPREEMAARTAGGELKYAGGSIAIHCFSVPLIRRLNAGGFALPYHRAHKKVPRVDASGKTVAPDKPNATKFEMFIFDALSFAQRHLAIETRREEEFSPVKNADGVDSPATARRDMSRLYARWLREIGVEVPREDGYPAHTIEISPLVGDDAESLAANYNGPRRVEGPLVIKY